MSTTLTEHDTRYVIVDGPGRDRVVQAFAHALVEGTPPVQFTTGHGRSQLAGFIMGLKHDDTADVADDKKGYRFYVLVSIDNRAYVGFYDSYTRSGYLEECTS